MKEKLTIYRPALAAFLTMMAMSLTSSTLSFFLEPVCRELEINRGSFSVVFSLMAVTGALTNPFLGQYASKKGVRNILLLSGGWVFASMVLFAAARQVWVLYLAALCIGAFSTNCAALCANVMVQQAYPPKKASGILGIVMAGSGAGGVLFNMLIPACISRWGWQAGAWAMGLSWLLLHLLAALLLGKAQIGQRDNRNPAEDMGMTRAEAIRSPKLYLLMGVIVIITASCGIQQQLPSLLRDYQLSTEQVSGMISLMTAFLALGKILQGFLYGRIGVKKGGIVMLAAFALGFAAMLSRALIWPGLVLLAFGMGVYTTLMPLVVRQVFGPRDYAAIWGLIAMVGSVGTFVANPVWGTIYDVTGTYAPGLVVCPLLLAGAMVSLTAAMKG